MSDARLRELERKWRETGAKDDFERYAWESVRCGNGVPVMDCSWDLDDVFASVHSDYIIQNIIGLVEGKCNGDYVHPHFKYGNHLHARSLTLEESMRAVVEKYESAERTNAVSVLSRSPGSLCWMTSNCFLDLHSKTQGYAEVTYDSVWDDLVDGEAELVMGERTIREVAGSQHWSRFTQDCFTCLVSDNSLRAAFERIYAEVLSQAFGSADLDEPLLLVPFWAAGSVCFVSIPTPYYYGRDDSVEHRGAGPGALIKKSKGASR